MKFDAAHQLPNYDGLCARPHGHTYKVKVDIEVRRLQKDYPFVIDFVDLKKVIEKYDHTNLNEFIDIPTAENIVVEIWNDINKKLIEHDLYHTLEIELWETETASITYDGNPAL